MQPQAAIAPTALAPADFKLTQRIWPLVLVVFGLALTAAWMGFLGYELVSLISLAF